MTHDPAAFPDAGRPRRAPDDRLADAPASRRGFLLAGLGVLLTGCATTSSARRLPEPAWDLPSQPPVSPSASIPEATVAAPPSAAPAPAPLIAPPPSAGVISRARWATGRPVPTLMNRMLPVRYITVHHDGMSPFFGNDSGAAAHRLDLIRNAHRGARWGDIGYHYSVDRTGNVWECRPLAWQGAHVKNHNEGNIGIMLLGNFDRQRPTDAQLAGLQRHLGLLMRTYHVPVDRIRTHQEWAATACPGRHVQSYMTWARTTRQFV